jgi:hypothetical protein
MKKLLMLIIVAGLVVFAAEGTGLASGGKVAPANIPPTITPDVVIGMQADDGLICVVYLEITDSDRPSPAAAFARADILQQLPDSTTLVLLGLGGLLYRRRKEVKV